MPWYGGPTLLDYLEAVDANVERRDAPFRLPVQLVLRHGDFRGYAGTVASGRIRPGDRLVDARTGLGASVRRIATMDGDLAFAAKGDAVAIELDTDLDISRGAVLSEAARRPINADVLEARLVWLAEAPFDPEGGYLLRTATDLTPVTSMSVSALVDFETLASAPAHACAVNDIADCRILLGRPTSLDLFAELPATGNFVLVSAVDGTTVAGGVISWAQSGAAAIGDNVFVLDRELLARGLCSDLGNSPADLAEFHRRAQEAAILLRSVGFRSYRDLNKKNSENWLTRGINPGKQGGDYSMIDMNWAAGLLPLIGAGFGVGFLVGLTGVGGGALMTPLLISSFGVSPRTPSAPTCSMPPSPKPPAAGAITSPITSNGRSCSGSRLAAFPPRLSCLPPSTSSRSTLPRWPIGSAWVSSSRCR